MNKKTHGAMRDKRSFGRSLSLALLVATGAATTLAPQVAAAQVSVSINVGPPPLRYEAVPAPRRGFVWVPGYWNWEGDRHVWIAGNWVAERHGYIYSQPTWVERGGRWELRRGAWARGDVDHDGIRNRRDRDRDGYGVRNRRDDRPNNPRRD